MCVLSGFLEGASKLWRTKAFGVKKTEGGSTGIWWPSRLKVFLVKRALKICSKFTGEQSCQSVILIKLQSKQPNIFLKLVCAIFYQIFIFNQMIALQKLWKMLFHLKSSFRLLDIQIFVFSSSSPDRV